MNNYRTNYSVWEKLQDAAVPIGFTLFLAGATYAIIATALAPSPYEKFLNDCAKNRVERTACESLWDSGSRRWRR